jgi:phage-related protein
MVTSASNAVDRVLRYITGLPGRILRGLGNLRDLLFDVGRDIMEGLWDGLKDIWGDVEDWFGSITDKIPDIKGPADKDRRLLYGAGNLIMDGLIAGLAAREAALRARLQGVTRTITDGIAGTSLGGELDSSTVAGMRFRDGGNTYVIQGAVDPVSTAKQLRDIQRREANWTGRLVGVVS